MTNPISPRAQAIPARKADEKEKTRPEEQSTPSPAPAPAPEQREGTNLTPFQGALDPKTAFDVGQGLTKPRQGTESVTGDGNKASPEEEESSSIDDAAKKIADQMGGGGTQQTSGGGNGVGRTESKGGASGVGRGDGKEEKEDEKPEAEKFDTPEQTPLQFMYHNYTLFDVGKEIGENKKLTMNGPDNKVSIKDLNGLKDNDNEEVAKNAKALIEDDIIGKLGGKDGKISREDIQKEFAKDFNLNDKYENIKIEEDTFSEDELKTFNDQLSLLANDPDGQRLLHHMNNKPGGVTLERSTEDSNGAATSGGGPEGTKVSFGEVDSDGAYLSVMAHEFTHAAIRQNGKSNDEALGSVLGHRIWSRNFEGEHDFTMDNGDDVKVGGSKEDEEMVFIEELKKRGDGTEDSYDAGHGDYLRSLGFEFDFDTNVYKFDGDKPVYGESDEAGGDDEEDHNHSH